MLHDEELVADLQSNLATLERERQRQVDVSQAPLEVDDLTQPVSSSEGYGEG